MRDDVARVLHATCLDGQRLHCNPTDDHESLTTHIALVDEDGAVETTFEVLFRLVSTCEDDTHGPFVYADDDDAYLVVTWVVFPSDEVSSSAPRRADLLVLLNEANFEPGVKFRLETYESRVTLLCEVDIPAAQLTPRAVERALARSRDVIAEFFDDLRPLVRPVPALLARGALRPQKLRAWGALSAGYDPTYYGAAPH